MDLFQSCLDLLMASKDTLTAALCWLLFYLVNYPDWQQSLHQEIMKVCGASGYPSYSERSRLPHVQAFISEVLRHASVVCVPPQHMLKVGATTLQGYDIPANAQVCANLWAVHHDESLWLNPHRFSPDRWLTPQGEYTECSTLIPFSIGQRLCVGSQLAEMVIFLFLTTLVQDFTFKPPEGVHDLPLDSTYRLARSPLPFDLIVECRKSN
ncbi:PREDICTED: cytochrome P450 2U1-like [Priapulus caudatus]|uniref:Cytochrome P450 2U1-like n=1 Tax=Priapulus caudatus TaxID=37621 RepID=A0ABM1FBP4_PRICU|nr:PREDICTED: cytochrome P450 2U1-like [Priapulus caudatus]